MRDAVDRRRLLYVCLMPPHTTLFPSQDPVNIAPDLTEDLITEAVTYDTFAIVSEILPPERGEVLSRRRSSLSHNDPNGTFPDFNDAIRNAASTPRRHSAALQGASPPHEDVERTFASPSLSPVRVPPSSSMEHDGLGSAATSRASGQRHRSAGSLTPQDTVFCPPASAEEQQTLPSAAVQPSHRQEPHSPPSEVEDEAVVTSPLSRHHRGDVGTVATVVGSGRHSSSNIGSVSDDDDLDLPAGVHVMELAEGRRRKKPLGPAPVPFGQSTRQLLALRQSLR